MIENTSNRDPFIHHIGAMADGTEKYITDMEAAGQQQFVTSAAMPREAPWDQLEALGFVRGEGIDGDALFISAQLPPGWAKRSTDHSMWSKIIDDRGVERVEVFYKAAHYDRRAFARILDIGGAFASTISYGDQQVQLPDYWDRLTDDEKAACRTSLDKELAYQRRNANLLVDGGGASDRDGARIARITAALALLDAAGVPRVA